jgi:hypothetical protein
VELAAGRAAPAEGLARGPFLAFESERQGEEAAEAAGALAQALAARGQRTEARAVIERAQALSAAREDAGTRLALALAHARLLEDAAALRAAREEAARCGLTGLVLEARLALAKAGAEDAATLARDAAARGFLRIARLAR